MYLRFLLMFSCLIISALSTINLKTFTFCLDRVYLCTESLWGWEFSCLLRRLFGCVPSTAPQVTYGVDSSVAELSNNSQYLHMYPFWRWEKYTHWNDDWYLDSRNKGPSWVWLFDFVFGGEQLPSALLSVFFFGGITCTSDSLSQSELPDKWTFLLRGSEISEPLCTTECSGSCWDSGSTSSETEWSDSESSDSGHILCGSGLTRCTCWLTISEEIINLRVFFASSFVERLSVVRHFLDACSIEKERTYRMS